MHRVFVARNVSNFRGTTSREWDASFHSLAILIDATNFYAVSPHRVHKFCMIDPARTIIDRAMIRIHFYKVRSPLCKFRFPFYGTCLLTRSSLISSWRGRDLFAHREASEIRPRGLWRRLLHCGPRKHPRQESYVITRKGGSVKQDRRYAVGNLTHHIVLRDCIEQRTRFSRFEFMSVLLYGFGNIPVPRNILFLHSTSAF